MGHSHYFPQTRSFTEAEWTDIKAFAKSLFNKNKEILADRHGDSGTKPTVNAVMISFNGIEDESHETCFITKAHSREFNFCKTNQKAYDVIVVALLTYINHIAPNVLTISSDGDSHKLQDGCNLTREILNDDSIELMTYRKLIAH